MALPRYRVDQTSVSSQNHRRIRTKGGHADVNVSCSPSAIPRLDKRDHFPPETVVIGKCHYRSTAEKEHLTNKVGLFGLLVLEGKHGPLILIRLNKE